MNEDSRAALTSELAASKLNLDDALDDFIHYRQVFFAKSPVSIFSGSDPDPKHPYLDLCTIINTMAPSYISPAYHYNNYVDAVIKDIEWDKIKWDIPEDMWSSGMLRRSTCQIEAQSLLVSTKTALDRLVSVFYYFYKGFSPDTTFGRYKKGKPSGFMAQVHRLKDADELMLFIEAEYNRWIKAAVAPRDLIIHYNDLGLTFHFDSACGALIPIHYSERLLETSSAKESEENSSSYDILMLRELVDNWQKFCLQVFSQLSDKAVVRDVGFI